MSTMPFVDLAMSGNSWFARIKALNHGVRTNTTQKVNIEEGGGLHLLDDNAS